MIYLANNCYSLILKVIKGFACKELIHVPFRPTGKTIHNVICSKLYWTSLLQCHLVLNYLSLWVVPMHISEKHNGWSVISLIFSCFIDWFLYIGWREWFSVILGSDQVKAGKPSPDLYDSDFTEILRLPFCLVRSYVLRILWKNTSGTLWHSQLFNLEGVPRPDHF